MARKLLRLLVPLRLVSLIFAFATTLTVYYTKVPLIQAELSDPWASVANHDSEYQKRNSQLLFLLSLSIVCYVTEGIGVLTGFTLSHARLHVLAFVSHFCGAIATLGMTLNWWGISAFPIIFTITILIPVSLDIVNCTIRWCMLPVGLR